MEFRLLMLSAMYENGGNTVHRFLDGHPEMFVYPFESQLGTNFGHDHLTSMFSVKYRWPEFSLEATPLQDYRAIIHEECKVRARTPHVSKFRHMPFDFNDDDRLDLFVKYASESGRSRAANVAAFFRATFDAWKDYRRTNQEKFYVGYSPIIAVDANKILTDFPRGHLLHVVRNPWSAYADTKKRPVPLSLERYITAWVTTQYHALVFQKFWPNNIHIVRYEDVIADPKACLGNVCAKIGIGASDSLKSPTWNARELEEVYPWGTIRKATPEANKETGRELSGDEIQAVRAWTDSYLDIFDDKNFLEK
jgi:hypothetical protein